MGVHRTCGEPDEIELTPMGVKLNAPRRDSEAYLQHELGLGRDLAPEPFSGKPVWRKNQSIYAICGRVPLFYMAN